MEGVESDARNEVSVLSAQLVNDSDGGTGYARYALAYPVAPVTILLYIRIAFEFVKRKEKTYLEWITPPRKAHLRRLTRPTQQRGASYLTNGSPQ